MTQYVLTTDWERVLEWTDSVPAQIKKSQNLHRGDVVDLDPDDPRDAGDIRRLTVQPHAALVLKEEWDARNPKTEREAQALVAARGATLTSPTDTNPVRALEDGYPDGQRTDSAATTVGAGGTDPEPQGFTGEAGQAPYDDEQAWSYADLQAAARARGLSAGGPRVDLVQRLREFDEREGAQFSKDVVEGNLDDKE